MADIFPFEVNWAQPVTMDREYKTEIITSRDKTEQRKPQRAEPRRTLTFDIQTDGSKSTDMYEWLEQEAQNPFWVPDPTRTVQTGAAVIVAATEIVLDAPAPRWLKVGSSLILGHGRDVARERVEVLEVDGATVSLTTGTTGNYALGATIRPAMYGRINQDLTGDYGTLTVGAFQIVFSEDPNPSYREVYRSQEDVNWFDGREVWMEKPNWRDKVNRNIMGNLATMKFDRGVFDHQSVHAFNTRMWEASYTGMSPEATERLIEFVHRKRGRRLDFWMPTWRRDMELAAESIVIDYDQTNGDGEPDDGPFEPDPVDLTKLVVSGTEAFDRHDGSEYINRLVVIFTDGSYAFNKVESMVVDSGDTTITVRDDWTRDITFADVERICWVPLWRLSSDTLSLTYQISGVGEAKLTMEQYRSDHTDDGYFPIISYYDMADETYDVTGLDLGFVNHGWTVGSLSFYWETYGRLRSDGSDANVILKVEVRKYLDDGAGGQGDEIGNVVVYQAQADGSVTLTFDLDLEPEARFVYLNYSLITTFPLFTDYDFFTDIVQFRGKP